MSLYNTKTIPHSLWTLLILTAGISYVTHTHSNTLMNLTVRSTTTLTHTNASVSVTSDRKSGIQYHLCSMKAALTLCYQPCDSDSSMCDNSTLERLQTASKHTCHPFFYLSLCDGMPGDVPHYHKHTKRDCIHIVALLVSITNTCSEEHKLHYEPAT